LKSQRN